MIAPPMLLSTDFTTPPIALPIPLTMLLMVFLFFRLK
jgi:hypothetical protein